MRRFKKATIRDVAEKAGVSITTVSRFVGGSESVCSPETAERIRTVITDLHYTPSSMVSSAVGRATKTLGVCMVSPLAGRITYGGFFYEQLWRGILAQASQADYALLMYPDAVYTGTSTDPFLDGRVDGLLYHLPAGARSSTNPDNRPVRLAAAGMPTVLLTRSRDLPDACGAAYANEAETTALALNHLWERGHRHIAHVAGPTGLGGDIGVGRLDGYRDWMQARGVYDPQMEAHADSWQANAAQMDAIVAAWQSAPNRPTAVFAANDALALAVITAAEARGWRVPTDLSVIGVDNTLEAAARGLTSVEPPMEEVGRASVRALFGLIQGLPILTCRLVIPVTTIVPRGTVAARAS